MIVQNATLHPTFLLCANGSLSEAVAGVKYVLRDCKSATPYAPSHITYVGYTVTVDEND
jgi:hypothetical protein